MPSDDPLRLVLPMLVLVAGIAASRVMSDRALGKLDSEQRAAAVHALATVHRWGILILLAVVLLGLLSSNFWLSMGGLAVYFVGTNVYAVLKVRAQLPAEYVRTMLLARGVLLLALAACVALFLHQA